jgi:hypothetical protein
MTTWGGGGLFDSEFTDLRPVQPVQNVILLHLQHFLQRVSAHVPYQELAATTHQYLLGVPVHIAIVLVVRNGIPAHQLDIVVKLLFANVISGHHAFLPSHNISCIPQRVLRLSF